MSLDDPRVDDATLDELERCGVATIVESLPSDAQQRLMGPEMQRRSTSRCVAGRAVTAYSGLGDNLMSHRGLSLLAEGDVLVVACAASTGAQCGELLARASQLKGARAVVVDGAVRDVDGIRELDFPVWSTSVNPRGTSKLQDTGVNITIVCAGALVRPGDVIVGDGDGVVVVPRAAVDIVLASARERTARERDMRERLERGEQFGDILGLAFGQLDAVASGSK